MTRLSGGSLSLSKYSSRVTHTSPYDILKCYAFKPNSLVLMFPADQRFDLFSLYRESCCERSEPLSPQATF